MTERENSLLKEQVKDMQDQVQKILGLVNGAYVRVKEGC